MPRRKKANLQRIVEADPQYGSVLIQRFINVVMWRGKKNCARKIMYDALGVLEKKSNGDREKAVELFNKAFDNVRPAIEVRSRRVGGSVYQIPRELQPDRSCALAIRWLVDAASSRSNKTMGERLAYELLDALENRGGAVKKKIDVHRMAEANRAFAHYSW